MAKKIGRVMGHRHNMDESGVIMSTTLFFHDGTSADVSGKVTILTNESLELVGTGQSPYTLKSVSPIQNCAA